MVKRENPTIAEDPISFLRNHMDRMFGIHNDLFTMDDYFGGNFPFGTFDDAFPITQLTREKNQYKIVMALAGYKREDIKVYVENGYLVIESDKVGPATKYQSYLSKKTIATRAFKQMYKVGDNPQISAKMEDGLLTIDVVYPEPKKDESSIKLIEIK
jgi:molecular chaperone IbpA